MGDYGDHAFSKTQKNLIKHIRIASDINEALARDQFQLYARLFYRFPGMKPGNEVLYKIDVEVVRPVFGGVVSGFAGGRLHTSTGRPPPTH